MRFRALLKNVDEEARARPRAPIIEGGGSTAATAVLGALVGNAIYYAAWVATPDAMIPDPNLNDSFLHCALGALIGFALGASSESRGVTWSRWLIAALTVGLISILVPHVVPLDLSSLDPAARNYLQKGMAVGLSLLFFALTDGFRWSTYSRKKKT